MDAHSLRKRFISFFVERDHRHLPSSPLLPKGDPTLLFVNAGMNQFKDIFLGREKATFPRAVTAQKCLRAGGKHNDLENVGHTISHLTFFEMLGNFSFGDYFKKEAIAFAWDVVEKVFGFDMERVHCTVFENDDEAFDLWREKVPLARISRMGAKDNFWSMGDTGPCGPCSELYYDRGAQYGEASSPKDDPGGRRYLEFWNLVFMQYDRTCDGEFTPLPQPSIDTGAGLERLLMIQEHENSLFATTLFADLIAAVEALFQRKYEKGGGRSCAPFHVIVDHLRALTFALADGIIPSNVERGYVLRKILRRAVRYGRHLGAKGPFLCRLVDPLVNSMGDDYEELKSAKTRVMEILHREEESFWRTLQRGGALLSEVIVEAKERAGVISGEEAFKLKDTYGLPLEEIELIARDEGLSIDERRFLILEEEARERSRSCEREKRHQQGNDALYQGLQKNSTTFTGYESCECQAKVITLLHQGAIVDLLSEEKEGEVILATTPFYGEKGGQVGDTGYLLGEGIKAYVFDTKLTAEGLVLHRARIERGTIRVGDLLSAKVNEERRRAIAKNHTATHLLHRALRETLGEHVHQAGSVVDEKRLRFDFTNHRPPSKEELIIIERRVNELIAMNLPRNVEEISLSEAKERRDLLMFFGEKYGERVRLVSFGPSKELCGGTHVDASGSIGSFHIVRESSIAQGVRRIEAVTGFEAIEQYHHLSATLEEAAKRFKSTPDLLVERIDQLFIEKNGLEKQLQALQDELLAGKLLPLLQQKEEIGELSLLLVKVKIPSKMAQRAAEVLESNASPLILLLVVDEEDRSHLLLSVDAKTAVLHPAQLLLEQIKPLLHGWKGGGQKRQARGIADRITSLEPMQEALKRYLRGER